MTRQDETCRAGRHVSMSELLGLIPDHSRIYAPPLMGPPTAIPHAMADEPERWTELETTCDYLAEPLAVFAHANTPFRHLSVQPSRALDGMAVTEFGVAELSGIDGAEREVRLRAIASPGLEL